MNLLEKLKAKARKILDRLAEIDAMDVEDYTDEVRDEAEAIMADLEKLNADIDAAEKRAAINADFAQPAPDTKDPIFNKIHDEENKDKGDKNGKRPAEPKEGHKYASFGDQLMDVFTVANVNAMSDSRQKASNRLESVRNAASGLGESVPSDGGFLVQTDYTTELLKRAYDTGLLVGECTSMPISANSNGVKLPKIDEKSRANGSRWGGIQAYWEGEGDAITASKPKFGELELRLRKLTGLCYATDEMLQDSAALGSYITQGFSEEFGFKFDDAIIRGTGAGQPLGLLNAACLVSQAKESGQAADTIVAENVEKMFSRMEARSVPSAKWYINQECWPQIFQLHHAVGTGGVPMYMEPGKLPETPNGSLLGRPIVPIEQCSALGDKGDIIFADLSRYLWADKGAMNAATSIHVRFVYDETAFRFIVRVDGQPMYDSALTPYKGASTLSPFVALANRA